MDMKEPLVQESKFEGNKKRYTDRATHMCCLAILQLILSGKNILTCKICIDWSCEHQQVMFRKFICDLKKTLASSVISLVNHPVTYEGTGIENTMKGE